MFDYPDLFREVANALRSQDQPNEALIFYRPLQAVSKQVDPTLLMDTASCYKVLGLRASAEGCYKRILEHDQAFTEARIALWNMNREQIELTMVDSSMSEPPKVSTVQTAREHSIVQACNPNLYTIS